MVSVHYVCFTGELLFVIKCAMVKRAFDSFIAVKLGSLQVYDAYMLHNECAFYDKYSAQTLKWDNVSIAGRSLRRMHIIIYASVDCLSFLNNELYSTRMRTITRYSKF